MRSSRSLSSEAAEHTTAPRKTWNGLGQQATPIWLVPPDHHPQRSSDIRTAPAASTTPTLLLSGLAASVGRGSGRARILTSPDQQREFLDGEVLVAEMTSPDWVPAMRRAAALITDGGGVTCHGAIVSRELQLPCVVGTGNATTSLRTGQEVTVDGRTGKVYAWRGRSGHRSEAVPTASGTRFTAGDQTVCEPGRR